MGIELLLVNLITALCVLCFIVLVAISGFSVTLNRRFIYFLLALLGWVVLNFLSNQTTLSYEVLLSVNRFVFVAALLAVVTMLRFCLSISSDKIPKVIDGAIWIATGAVSFLALSPYVVESIDIREPVVGVTFGLASTVYFITLACFAVWVVLKLVYDAARAQGVVKSRARSLLLAFGVGLVVVAVTNAVLPVFFNIFYFSAVGSFVTVVMLVGVGYSIVRHKLFDIRLAIVRGATYIFTLSTLACVYYLSAYTVSVTLFDSRSVGTDQALVDTALALLLAFIFQPIKRFFDRLTNKVFYRDNYSVDEFFARLSRVLSSSTDLRTLLQHAASEIKGTIKAEHSFFFVRYGDGGHMTAGTAHHGRIYPKEIDKLDEFTATRGQSAIITDTLDERDPLYRLLTKRDITITMPLLRDDRILGYLFLGSQRSRDYTRRDIRALETISDELVIAIQNALSVQEVKEINATLQQRIHDATKELRRSNTQLQRLDAAKDDFVSMASHQLRTPLTSVKGYISMVLEGDAGRISSVQRQLLGEAFTSSERMVHLINDFLNVSRLQTGKFIIDSRPIDLAKLVGQEVDSLKTTAGAHELKLSYRTPSYFPTLSIDEGKIRQVVMNFIDNAIYYSHEGTTITVKLYVDGGNAVFEVHDTGIGVPESEQAHLFGKFFRATNARKQRPDGTGVGLFLSKKVIDAHGGSMVFKSVEGEGSTFGFRLPIKQLSAEDQTKELEK